MLQTQRLNCPHERRRELFLKPSEAPRKLAATRVAGSAPDAL